MSALSDRPSNLYGLERRDLAEIMTDLGAAPFHAGQAYRWMYARGRTDPAQWTDHAGPLRTAIAESYRIDPGRLVGSVTAADGTVKYRVAPSEGDLVESVYMVADDGRITLCVSSQVGCALGCDFCLTAKMGFGRHLGAGEIVGQVAALVRGSGIAGGTFNVVFMGMGEPLHNYDAVLAAVRILTDPDGFGMSRRRITVSTVGLVPGIERLAREPVRPRLAVSLNATTDSLRDRLMPVNAKWDLSALLGACQRYVAATGDRITFEYVLLDGINDDDEDLGRLIAIARRVRSKVNLIPFNEVADRLPYRSPSEARVDRFRDGLAARGIPASVRWSRGRDAGAACGQLAVALEGVER